MSQSRPRILVRTILRVAADIVSLVSSALRSRAQLAAENLFLRKQLALYLERQVKPHRAADASRIMLVALSRFIKWRRLLTSVKPDTLIRWHRKGFRLFWHWKSRAPGRPPIPADLRQLIATMAIANRTWGEERIAAELLLKLGIRISPRTVRRYMPSRPLRGTTGTQKWSTFVRNHAQTVLACDFFVTVTATFRMLYVFVVLEVGTRRILHWNVTAHPTAEWTAQQFRLIIPGDQTHRFVIHDRDTIYSEGVDRTLAAMGLTVLKTPVRAPTANGFCERLVGTMRRECLDFVIPLNERQLRSVLREWVAHYNRGRLHASLGRVSRIDHRSRLPSRRTAIVFRWTTGFCQPRSWAGCITNTDWNGLREGLAPDAALFLRSTGLQPVVVTPHAILADERRRILVGRSRGLISAERRREK